MDVNSNMITDSFFQQGSTHAVCEDYALHGQNFAILSDGCSNGHGPSINSDWGARLLCKAAQQCLSMLGPESSSKIIDFFLEVGKTAKEQVEIISNLAPECLTATLAIIHEHSNSIHHTQIGDGFVGARRRDGQWEIKCIEPQNHGCFYLKYLLFEGESEKWHNRFGGGYTETLYRGDLYNPDSMETQVKSFNIDLSQPHFSHSFPKEDYDLVFIGSDGLSSFSKIIKTPTSKHKEMISLLRAIGTIFKDIQFCNSCLQIQRNWAWKQNSPDTFLTNGWNNSDDVSIGMIYNG